MPMAEIAQRAADVVAAYDEAVAREARHAV
jgi:hypothetical protein